MSGIYICMLIRYCFFFSSFFSCFRKLKKKKNNFPKCQKNDMCVYLQKNACIYHLSLPLLNVRKFSFCSVIAQAWCTVGVQKICVGYSMTWLLIAVLIFSSSARCLFFSRRRTCFGSSFGQALSAFWNWYASYAWGEVSFCFCFHLTWGRGGERARELLDLFNI